MTISIYDHRVREIAGQMILLHGERAAGRTQQLMAAASAGNRFEEARTWNVILHAILALQMPERGDAPLN